MSTILKAIDRLEREKQKRNDARPLREEVAQRHVVGRPSPAAPRGTLIGLASGLVLLGVVVAVAVGIYAVLTSNSDRQVVAGQTEQPVDERAVTQVVADASPPRRGKEVVAVAPAQQQSVPPVASASQIAVDEKPGVEVSALEPRAAAPASAHASSLRAGTPDDEEALPASTTPAVSSPPPRARPLAKTALRQEIPTPAPVAESKGAIRDVVVARTIWHPNADRRLALIEISGQLEPLRVGEGDSVGSLLVKKIEPSGVVFLDDEVEILRRVGARD